MAKLSGKEIQKLARSIVAENPGGIRYSELVERVSQQTPETPRNTIHGSVWNLDTIFPNEIAKPSRGLFTPVAKPSNEAADVGSAEEIAPSGVKIKEAEFYQPFADWLKNDLDEVTEVASLGGAGLKSKWGTPDVVGIYKPLASNLIKFPIEIVSAEIKIDPQAPVVAFGQAVAYRLFSTKTYIAMPKDSHRRRPEPTGVTVHALRSWAGDIRPEPGRAPVLNSCTCSAFISYPS
jgi:hypothetical protein